MRLSEFFCLHKADRQVLVVLLVVAVVALGLLRFTGDEGVQAEHALSAGSPDTVVQTVPAPAPSYFRAEGRKVERFFFDPNTADSVQLLRLGLLPWQVRNVYKYRASGGIFRKKEDFARLYGLTVKQYRELEPYIRISEDYQPAAILLESDARQRDTLRFPEKIAEGETVDLVVADTTQLRKVPGIGAYFAREVVKYGRRLGGYVSVDQLDEIEGFPTESKKFFVVGAAAPHKLNLNRLTLNDLRRHPYLNYYQARAIVDYRRLRGPLHSLDDLELLPDFPHEAIERLTPYVEF